METRSFMCFFIVPIFLISWAHSAESTTGQAAAAAAPATSENQDQLGKLNQELIDLMKQVDKRNTLKFGDHCTPNFEDKRGQLAKQLLNFTNSVLVLNISNAKEVEPQISQMKAYVEEFLSGLEKNESLCNVFSYLQCNRSSAKCDCANGEEFGLKNIKFIKVGDSCKAAKGAFCAPDLSNMTKMANRFFGSKPTTLTCESGSTCIVKSSGKAKVQCDQKNFMEEFSKMTKGPAGAAGKNGTAAPTALSLALKSIQEGICTCSSAWKLEIPSGLKAAFLMGGLLISSAIFN